MSASPAGRVLDIDTAADLDRRAVLAVAAGARLRLGEGLLDRLDARRAEVLSALEGDADVYGVNTGMGALSGIRLTAEEQLAHQRTLLLARAVGGPPYLDPAEVRALLAVRLRTFLSGDAGVSAGLCRTLVELLDSGVVPAVPRAGAGSAGEIVPLAHAFQTLMGVGTVLVAGETRPAAATLAAGGIEPVALGPKEGVALLAGVPTATALALLRAATARRLADALLAVAAGSVALVRAPRDPYQPSTGRGDPVLAALHARLLALAGAEAEPRMLQAPVSFRVVGPVLAQVERAAAALEAAVDRALDGVTDSPAYLDGRLLGTAGFHGVDLAAHLDALSLALAHAGEVAAARVHRLLDSRVTGLPAQLAASPGAETGLVVVHKRAAAAVHAARRAALPALLGTMETSGGQEDVQSFAAAAAEQLRVVLGLVAEVAATEALALRQAYALARTPPPVGLRGLMRRLAELVPPIEGDRPFGADLERLLGALADGTLGTPQISALPVPAVQPGEQSPQQQPADGNVEDGAHPPGAADRRDAAQAADRGDAAQRGDRADAGERADGGDAPHAAE